MSAPQDMENDPTNKEALKRNSIALHTDEIIETYNVKIIMQYIPGHSGIPVNEKADTLTKQGSRQCSKLAAARCS